MSKNTMEVGDEAKNMDYDCNCATLVSLLRYFGIITESS